MIGDEDHRVRTAVANCLVGLVRTWTNLEISPDILRIKRLDSIMGRKSCDLDAPFVTEVPISVSGLAKCFEDQPRDEDAVSNLTLFVEHLLSWLATSNSKFTKVTR